MRDIAAFIKSHDDFLKDYYEWLDKLNKEDGTYERELEFKKEKRIKSWIKQGMVDTFNDNYKTIWNRYNDTTHCEICNKSFNNNRMNMEHNHTTGFFRGFVCTRCNIRIAQEETPRKNTTGIPYLNYTHFKRNNEWLYVYNRTYTFNYVQYKPRDYKKFKKVEDAIAFAVINQIINEMEDDTILKIQEWVKK